MDGLIGVIVSGIISILVAYITAYQKTKNELNKERAKAELEVVMRQKHEYFYPFKNCANEFRGRLIHIERRLKDRNNDPEKHENMIRRLRQDFTSKKPEWFFNDSVGIEGGYFISSTIYQNCLLFYWIKRIQQEHPFIPLKIRNTNFKNDKLPASINKEECDIYDFIKNIKLAIALKKGIPFALHDSIGDFLYNYSEKRVLNYDEFCEQLRDENKRVKFTPVLNFWTNLVDNENKVDEERLAKIRALIAILKVLKDADIVSK